MPIFLIKDNRLKLIKASNFKKEDEIQGLIESSLDETFGLEFVTSQFTVKNLRIDTLAFDNRTKSFVILEYKKDKKLSMVEQGFVYLSLLLNNNADFLLKYNEEGKSIKINEVDWAQSKVLFISPSFTKYQKGSLNLRDLPYELWEVSKYENDIVSLNRLQPLETSESLSKIARKGKTTRKRETTFVRPSSRNILVSSSVNVPSGSDVALDFTNIIFLGGQFFLVWSKDGFSQISSGDFRYTPTFTTAQLHSATPTEVEGTSVYPGVWRIGKDRVNGSIPKNIAGGHYYVKAFEGSITSVAVTDKCINVL